MTALATIDARELSFPLGLPRPEAMPANLPSSGQFAAVTALIRQVFQVPAVAITLHVAPGVAEGGVYRAFLETPLLRDGESIGALRILDTVARSFGERDCDMLEGFARLVVEQVDLWSEARSDLLTGAMTRRAFEAELDKAVAARQRGQGTSALILLDIDHFKRVNDTLGHAAGDAVLRATARTVMAELRSVDAFGRVGGEEFAVLLSQADAAEALDVAERIRRAVAAMRVPGLPELRVTSSFGVAEMTGAAPAAQMAAADGALYAAKHGGRNRVELAADPSRLM